MMEQLHTIDVAVIFCYFIFLLFIGFRLLRTRRDDVSSYLLAGRRLTLPSFVATLVTTWYGGILGVGEFSYSYGISNWLVFGVPYYIAATIFALFIAKRARRFELYTIPQQLDRHYGKAASLVGSFFLFVMTVPAAYILMLAVLLKFFFNWSLLAGLIIGATLSTCYVLIGGFNSVVKTDKLQFGLMFGGFLFILPIAAIKYGGFSFLTANIPASHLLWHGGNDAQYIFVWYFIALATLVEPGFYQRCFAARDENVAQRGILISILFWIFFDFLTTFTGLYTRAIIPNLNDPITSYLDLAVIVLPPFVRGLFFAGLMATIMSTIDSYSFLAAMTLGRDVIWRLQHNAAEERINFYTRWGLVASGILAVAIAYYAQSIIRIWKDLGSIGTPALLIPLVTSFFPKLRMRSDFVLVAMIGSAILSGGWLFAKQIPFFSGEYPLGVEPIYPGLGFSILLFLADKTGAMLKDLGKAERNY